MDSSTTFDKHARLVPPEREEMDFLNMEFMNRDSSINDRVTPIEEAKSMLNSSDIEILG